MNRDSSSGQTARRDTRELGRQGEAAARRYLDSRGLRFVAANVRTRYGEIDLIFRDGAELVFVEVKTRLAGASVGPLEAITQAKAHRMQRLAEGYLAERGQEIPWRMDVVAVYVEADGAAPRVMHLVHALSE